MAAAVLLTSGGVQAKTIDTDRWTGEATVNRNYILEDDEVLKVNNKAWLKEPTLINNATIHAGGIDIGVLGMGGKIINNGEIVLSSTQSSGLIDGLIDGVINGVSGDDEKLKEALIKIKEALPQLSTFGHLGFGQTVGNNGSFTLQKNDGTKTSFGNFGGSLTNNANGTFNAGMLVNAGFEGLAGKVDNSGLMNLEGVFQLGGTITNSGTVNASGFGADNLINGLLETVELPDQIKNIITSITGTAGLMPKIGHIQVAGDVVNTVDGTWNITDVAGNGTVLGAVLGGNFKNEGTLNADLMLNAGVLGGTLENSGEFNTNALINAAGRTVNNSGATVNASGYGVDDVTGALVDSGIVPEEVVSIIKTAAGTLPKVGHVQTGGEVENNGTWNITDETGGGKVLGAVVGGTFANNGTLNADLMLNAGVLGGKIENSGEFNAKALINAAGTTVNTGTVNVSGYKTDGVAKVVGKVIADQTGLDQQLVEDVIDLTVPDVGLVQTAGTVENKGTWNLDSAGVVLGGEFKNQDQGKLNADLLASVAAGVLNNEAGGTLDASGLVSSVGGKVDNSGRLDVTGSVLPVDKLAEAAADAVPELAGLINAAAGAVPKIGQLNFYGSMQNNVGGVWNSGKEVNVFGKTSNFGAYNSDWILSYGSEFTNEEGGVLDASVALQVDSKFTNNGTAVVDSLAMISTGVGGAKSEFVNNGTLTTTVGFEVLPGVADWIEANAPKLGDLLPSNEVDLGYLQVGGQGFNNGTWTASKQLLVNAALQSNGKLDAQWLMGVDSTFENKGALDADIVAGYGLTFRNNNTVTSGAERAVVDSLFMLNSTLENNGYLETRVGFDTAPILIDKIIAALDPVKHADVIAALEKIPTEVDLGGIQVGGQSINNGTWNAGKQLLIGGKLVNNGYYDSDWLLTAGGKVENNSLIDSSITAGVNLDFTNNEGANAVIDSLITAGSTVVNNGSLTTVVGIDASAPIDALIGLLDEEKHADLIAFLKKLPTDVKLGGFQYGGSLENNGTWTASNQIVVDGSIVNNGELKVDSMTAAGARGEFVNNGELDAQAVVALNKAGFINKADGEGEAKSKFYIGVDAASRNEGKLDLRNELDLTSAKQKVVEALRNAELPFGGSLDAQADWIEANVDVSHIPTLSQVVLGGSFENAAGAQLHSSGTLVAFDGELKNAGVMNADALMATEKGRVVNSGTMTITAASGFRDAEFINSGSLTAEHAVFNKIRFTQSGPAAVLDLSGHWFTNSRVAFEGSSYNLVRVGSGLFEGGNEYHVSADGYGNTGVLEAEIFGGDNSIHLGTGGTLKVAQIDVFTKDTGYSPERSGIYFEGGTLETGVDQVFSGYASAEGYEGWFVGETVAGVSVDAVKESLTDRIFVSSEGGKLAFNDKLVSTDLLASINSALSDASLGGLTVGFNSEFVEGNRWDITGANDVINSIANGEQGDVDFVFNTVELSATNPDGEENAALKLDGDVLVAAGSTGFRNVVDVEKVRVEDGVDFTLAGFADASRGSLVGGGGFVEVGEGAGLNLGFADSIRTSGSLESVALNSGRLSAVDGEFVVGSVDAVSSSVGNSAFLMVGTLDLNDSTVDNKGRLVVDSIEFTGGVSTIGNGDATAASNSAELLVKSGVELGANRLVNSGVFAAAGDLSAAAGGVVENSGEMLVQNLRLNEAGAEFNNSGEFGVVGKAEVKGSFKQTAGAFSAAGLEVSENGTFAAEGGSVDVGSALVKGIGAAFEASNGSIVNMDELKLEGGRMEVTSAAVMVGADMGAALADGESRLVVGSRIEIGGGSQLIVGQAPTAADNFTGTGVWFGSGSNLQIGTSDLFVDAPLFVDVDGTRGTFVAADGSELTILGSNSGWGSYKVVLADNFNVTFGEDSWLLPENVHTDDDTNVSVSFNEEDGTLEIFVGTDDIRDKLPNVAIPNLVNEVMADDFRNPNAAGSKGFLAEAIENGRLAEELQEETINSTAQIMAAGGLAYQGMNLVGNILDMQERHLGMTDVHFRNGELQRWEGARFWVDAIGQKFDVDDARMTGGDARFDGDNTGFIMGADLLASCGARYGAAFSYQKGDASSVDSVVKTSNKSDAYGFSLYAAKTVGLVNVIGTAGYTRISSELEQTLPGMLSGKHGSHSLDVDNNVFSASVRGEVRFAGAEGKMSFIPYIGARLINMDGVEESSRMDGASAFAYDMGSVTQVQMPIGAAFEAYSPVGAWTARTVIDLSVAPVLGDKSAETTIGIAGMTSTDAVENVFASDVVGKMQFGAAFEKGAASIGVNAAAAVGSRSESFSLGVNARYSF